MATKNLCFIAERYSYHGGGERMLALLCNELVKRYNITILTLLEDKKPSNYVFNENIIVKHAYIRKINVNLLPRVSLLLTRLLELCWLLKYREYLTMFDTIIGLGLAPNILLGVMSKYLPDKKTIGWVHNSYYGEGSFIYRIFRSLTYKNLSQLVVLTKTELGRFKKLSCNTCVIYNFIPEKKDKMTNLYANKQFIFAGRINKKQKGIDLLCKILKVYYKKSKNPWKCRIIGSGKDNEYLLNYIKKNNLTSYVEYMANTNEIEKEYRRSSCLLLTSRFEGFPMVLLEAASLGLPVISFDCPTGPSEIIKDGGNGFLAPQYDINMFVKRMLEVECDEKLVQDFSTNAYETSKKFMAGTIIPQWLELIDKQV